MNVCYIYLYDNDFNNIQGEKMMILQFTIYYG